MAGRTLGLFAAEPTFVGSKLHSDPGELSCLHPDFPCYHKATGLAPRHTMRASPPET